MALCLVLLLSLPSSSEPSTITTSELPPISAVTDSEPSPSTPTLSDINSDGFQLAVKGKLEEAISLLTPALDSHAQAQQGKQQVAQGNEDGRQRQIPEPGSKGFDDFAVYAEGKVLLAQLHFAKREFASAAQQMRDLVELDETYLLAQGAMKLYEGLELQEKQEYEQAHEKMVESMRAGKGTVSSMAELEKLAVAFGSIGDTARAAGLIRDLWRFQMGVSDPTSLAFNFNIHTPNAWVRALEEVDRLWDRAALEDSRLQSGDAVVQQLLSDLGNITRPTHTCTLSISVAQGPPADIKLVLYGRASPRAVLNFVNMANCNDPLEVREEGVKSGALPFWFYVPHHSGLSSSSSFSTYNTTTSSLSEVKLSHEKCYRGSAIHRVSLNFLLQGGDVSRGDGTGKVTVYDRPFGDDPLGLLLMHDKGVLSAVSSEAGRNWGQFSIVLKPSHHLNTKMAVMGRVVDGWDVLEQINKVPTTSKDNKGHFTPIIPIVLVHSSCGLLPVAAL